jgi:hypothetical protein
MQGIKAELTTSELMKLLLAAIIIVILIILSASLYGIFTAKSKIQQASSALDEIAIKMNLAKQGETKEVLITGPSEFGLSNSVNWKMISFSGNNNIGECNSKACLCFCQTGSENSCSEQRKCKVFAESIIIIESNVIDKKMPYTLQIKKLAEDRYSLGVK